MLENGIHETDVPVEREWVLPVAQGQKWSLRRLAGGFDALPERGDDIGVEDEGKSQKLTEFLEMKKQGKWGGKRLLLAMVNRGMGGDGTVVYYIVMEGSVKPRQN
jgi:tRNA-splicing endonuclease subunit Sen15